MTFLKKACIARFATSLWLIAVSRHSPRFLKFRNIFLLFQDIMLTANVFFLINTQWNNEKNKIKLDTVKKIVTMKSNLKEFSCVRSSIYIVI